jgi:hypothetical protein
MDKTLLVTRPKYDDGTEYLSAYSLLVMKYANEQGIDLKDFEGKNANKQEIEKYLKKKNPSLFFLNGHGNEHEIDGHKETIFSVNNNLNLLKGRIVYARACSAANSLGKEVVKDNKGCFIGYRYSFSFWMDGKWSAKPLNDKSAALYLKPSNEIILSLLAGKSAAEANERSKRLMVDNMKKLLVLGEKNQPEAMGMLQILWDNYDGQVLLGNEEARF